MSDLISRQAILKHIEKIRQGLQMMDDTPIMNAIIMNGMNLCEKAVRNQPSAQPERKKGKWIYKKDLKQFFCDQCGEPSLTDDDRYIYGMDFSNFCPNCGAEMEYDHETY